ncbi:MAG: MoaD/ThiS family protein [Planctomycetales bacterium]
MATAFIPPALRELTGGRGQVDVAGTSVRQVVASLEAQFPGLRDRLCVGNDLRPGLAIAINGVVTSLGLLQKVPENAEVHFLPALGGG